MSVPLATDVKAGNFHLVYLIDQFINEKIRKFNLTGADT